MRALALVPALLLLFAHTCFAQSKHSIRSSVRGNDSVRVAPSMPWVTEFTPPPIYDTWWKEIAACEKLPLPIELVKSVVWVEVNSVTFRVGLRRESAYGFTDPEHNTIYLALPSVLEEEVVKHEMVHQLDWWHGEDEGEDYHPQDRFEVCGLHTFHA